MAYSFLRKGLVRNLQKRVLFSLVSVAGASGTRRSFRDGAVCKEYESSSLRHRDRQESPSFLLSADRRKLKLLRRDEERSGVLLPKTFHRWLLKMDEPRRKPELRLNSLLEKDAPGAPLRRFISRTLILKGRGELIVPLHGGWPWGSHFRPDRCFRRSSSPPRELGPGSALGLLVSPFPTEHRLLGLCF